MREVGDDPSHTRNHRIQAGYDRNIRSISVPPEADPVVAHSPLDAENAVGIVPFFGKNGQYPFEQQGIWVNERNRPASV